MESNEILRQGLSERADEIRRNPIKKLKVVWGNWHHDFELTGTPSSGNGVMVAHVTDESMRELLEADRPME